MRLRRTRLCRGDTHASCEDIHKEHFVIRLCLAFALTGLAACNSYKHELMENCITRVQADSTPSVTASDIRAVCKKRLNSYSSSQSSAG